MTQLLPDERLDCEEVLKEKHLWSLDKNEFEIEKDLNFILDSKTEDENYLIYALIFLKIQNK